MKRCCVSPPQRGLAVIFLGSLLFAGCAVGPNYHRPQVEVPRAFAENSPWKFAEPRDAERKPAWWEVFHDPILNDLEIQAQKSSPTLQAALARYDAALAIAGVSRAALLPNLSFDPNASRERFSGNRQTPTAAQRAAYTSNSFELPLHLSYELDVFGKARRALESAREAAASQGATYENVLLTVQADVAQSYFGLRSLRSQGLIYRRNVALLQDTLDLTRRLRAGGVNSDVDVYQAEAQLETVRNGALVVDQNYSAQSHALAVLVGQNPESFAIEIKPLDLDPPPLPVGLPSDLLERRPDVAAAERTLASVNAQIGVAKAAFFPSIGLTAVAGLNSSALDKLFQWSSREWTVGGNLNQSIFNGGALLANYRVAKANYEAALANYREQILSALGEVETGLSDLRYLREQNDVLGRAVDASQHLQDLATTRYQNGVVSYLEVIDAQRTLLQSQLALTQNRAQRLGATVVLIKALGGGWDGQTLPK